MVPGCSRATFYDPGRDCTCGATGCPMLCSKKPDPHAIIWHLPKSKEKVKTIKGQPDDWYRKFEQRR